MKVLLKECALLGNKKKKPSNQCHDKQSTDNLNRDVNDEYQNVFTVLNLCLQNTPSFIKNQSTCTPPNSCVKMHQPVFSSYCKKFYMKYQRCALENIV